MTAHAGKDMEYKERSSIDIWGTNLDTHYGNQHRDFSGNWEYIYLKIQQYHSWGIYLKDN